MSMMMRMTAAVLMWCWWWWWQTPIMYTCIQAYVLMYTCCLCLKPLKVRSEGVATCCNIPILDQWSWLDTLASGNVTFCYGKWLYIGGWSACLKWWKSVAMFNYQRVGLDAFESPLTGWYRTVSTKEWSLHGITKPSCYQNTISLKELFWNRVNMGPSGTHVKIQKIKKPFVRLFNFQFRTHQSIRGI